MDLREQGERKYGRSHILASSASRAWTAIAADLRHHPAGEIPSFRPEHLEIGIAVDCHPDCIVRRTGDGLRQQTFVEPGTVWLCPAGVLEQDICINRWHDVLHLYLPPACFARVGELRGGAPVPPDAVRYLGGFHDGPIREAGRSLMAEMRDPTSSGLVLAETIALSLAAHVAAAYASHASPAAALRTRHRLDERRLRRVLDYLHENLEAEIGLEDLAAAANLSPFHFHRMFRRKMGQPPHRYLSALRLERAKALLSLGRRPIAEVALACCFSSQSNFTRAFRRATGTTPMRYRRCAG